MFTKPLAIGPLTLKNRFVMSAMATGFLELNGRPNKRYIDFLERRAKGDVAMIIVESTGVLKEFRYNLRTPSIAIDEDIPSWKALTETIHQHDCYIAMQLQHPGKQVYTTTVGDVVSASDIPQKVTGVVAKPLTKDEITYYADSFGKGAKRAMQANFDAIEIHAGHGYLFSQFLSTYSNNRTDEYGGTLENRFRFLKETLESIQRYTNKKLPIIVRMSFTEFVDGGMPIEETLQVAKWLEEMGVVAIRVSGGNVDQSEPIMIPPTDVRKGVFWEFSKIAKEHLSIPVDAVGKIQGFEEANMLLNEGYSDFISLARPLVADPDYVKKMITGKSEDIRPCIACNQGCIDRLLDDQIGEISCLINQEVGLEGKKLLEGQAEVPRKVLIVGGGPAGMEAARVASLKGHDVTLVEKAAQLGGTFNLATLPPGKKDFSKLPLYFGRQLKNQGVKVLLNQEITNELVNELEPEVVIWATGAKKGLPNINTDIPVISAEAVFAARPGKDQRIVFYGAKWESVETALLLATEGYKVSIVEENPKLGQAISQVTRRWFLRKKLKALGVEIFENAKGVKFANKLCTFTIGGEQKDLAADLVIVEPIRDANVATLGLPTHIQQITIGDAKDPRNTYYAIKDGFKAALEINATSLQV